MVHVESEGDLVDSFLNRSINELCQYLESLDIDAVVVLLKKGSPLVNNYGTTNGKLFLQEQSQIVEQFVCYCNGPDETVDNPREDKEVKSEVNPDCAHDQIAACDSHNSDERFSSIQDDVYHTAEYDVSTSTNENGTTIREYTSQSASSHQTTKYTCLICTKDFTYRTSYTRHVKTFHRNKPFKCQECDDQFQTENQFVKHKQKHVSGQCFSCDKCDRVYKSKKSLYNHRRSSHTNIRFQCKVCWKFFNYSHGLARHEKSHAEIRDYKCSFCDKTFKNKKDQVNHENNIHTKVNQYICHLCGTATSSPTVYRNHMRKHEGKTIKLARNCRYCGESLTNYTALVRHIMKLHEQEDLEHKTPLLRRCRVCSQVFPQRSIQIHEDTHVGVKRFSCNHCHCRFSCAPNLQAHLRTVHRDTPMFCAMCLEHFVNRMALNKHLALHQNHVESVC